jgi:cytoskeletal protein CcmA (bactofilin family)
VPAPTRIDGAIETPFDLTVFGICDGTIHIGGTLAIEAGATCRATVRARRAVIRGELLGNIVCSEAIEVAAGGRVVGDLRAPDVLVDGAAEVDGRVDLLAPAPDGAGFERAPAKIRGPGLRRPSPPLPVTEVKTR